MRRKDTGADRAPPAEPMAEDSPLEDAELLASVLVRWDLGHITTTYMRTLASELERRLLVGTSL
ncbi:hypothetical protein [Nocardiopsis valliformis]|uniref:hypothetical protein n=1 Tax=Nocardiopsis valliformis TaxID=239974 RepID=UPI000373DE93|nr:hypothetical protein [Nocardiopsis valliformis]